MEVLNRQLYRFAGVEIDPSQNCLKIGNQDLYLRYKLMQLLVYLIEERHRVVSKRDLIENIWEGAVITDDALVQSIKELRRALNDDPRQPRFIKTIPKVGYRFIAEVETLGLNDLATIHCEEHTSVEFEYEEITDSESPLPVIALPIASTPIIEKSRRRRIYLFAIAASLLIVAMLTVYLFRQGNRQLPEIALSELAGKRSVAVMYFDNQSGNPHLDWLREGLADMLITNLSRSDKLTLLNRRQLHLLLERIGYNSGNNIRLDDALHIAELSRAEIIALGSFANVNDSIRIDVQLYDTRHHQLLTSEHLVVDTPKDLLTNIDLLSLKLAAHLRPDPDGQEKTGSLAEVMTNNLEAYRAYSLAVEKAQALHNEEAIALLEKAIALDPQFAMAYGRIGYAYAVTDSHALKARPYLEKAFQLANRLTEKDRLYIIAWYAIANFDYPGAIEPFKKIIAQYPLEVEAYLRLGYLLRGESRYAEAINVLKQGLVVDPDAKEIYNALGLIYLDRYRYDEAIAAHRHYVELAPAEANAHDSLAMSYQCAGRYDEAIAEYQRAIDLKPNFHIAHFHLGNSYFQTGRYQAAIAQYHKSLEVAPNDRERAVAYDRLAKIYLRKGDLHRASALTKRTLQYEKSYVWTPLLLALQRGDLKSVEKFKASIFAQSPFGHRGQRPPMRTYSYIRGYLALKSGQQAEAINHFKAAIQYAPLIWEIDSLEDCLASAYLESGRWDEAIAEYQRIINTNPNYPLAHYHLAQAFEQKGDTDKARALYAHFLQAWKHADPELPEIIRSKKVLAG
ncbi:MAG: tetratricopeptide repeat protein [Acidobacteriota bacterium]